MECFGREQEASDLWRLLADKQNVLLLAPRRVGKTVLLNHMRETAIEAGYRPILLDVEGLGEEQEFLRALCAQIQDHLSIGRRVMSALALRINKAVRGDAVEVKDWRQWLLEIDWQEFADHLLAQLDEHEDGAPWLILVDELPVFLQALFNAHGEERLRRFLYWLRSIRQRRREVRWLYTGSIGLDVLARQHGVEGALNDLTPATLAAFDNDTADRFLNSIGARRRRRISGAARTAIVERLGWLSPYYLERIAEDACAQVREGAEVGEREAQAAMGQLLDLGKRLYWSAWREHLERNFQQPERGHLYAVLEVIAKQPGGLSFDGVLAALHLQGRQLDKAHLRSLLDTLVADGYLKSVTGTFDFRMYLMREWWTRHVVVVEPAA